MEKNPEKPRRGRPSLADDARRDSRLVVKLTAGERAEIDAAGDTAWARTVLLRAARRAK